MRLWGWSWDEGILNIYKDWSRSYVSVATIARKYSSETRFSGTSVCINMGCNCGKLRTSPASCLLSPFLCHMVTELDLLAKMMDVWSKPGKQSPLMGFFKWDLEERSSIFLTSESCSQCKKWIIGEWDQQKEPRERGKKKKSSGFH